MASHVKKKPVPVKAIVISICSVLAVGLVVAGILLINNGFLDTVAGIMGISKEAASSAISDQPSSEGGFTPSGEGSSDANSANSSSTPVEIIKGSGNYTRPEQMRGVWLTPGVDYLLAADGKETLSSADLLRARWQHHVGDEMTLTLWRRGEILTVTLELTEAAHEFIGDAAYDPHYGARPLKRYLQSHVETPLAKFIIGGQVRDDQRVVIDATEEGLTFGVKSGDTVQPL